MKISFVSPRLAAILAVVAIATAALLGSLSYGQQNAQQNGPFVAVVDLGKILKNYDRFNRDLDQLKSEAAAEEKNLQMRNNEIQQMKQQLSGMKPDSPDYNHNFTVMNQKQGDLNVERALKQREFGDRRAKMILQAYREIQLATREYAGQRNIAMVIPYDNNVLIDGFSSLPPAPLKPGEAPPAVPEITPNEVPGVISRPVLYVHSSLDVTLDVLNSVNRTSNASTAPIGVGGPR